MLACGFSKNLRKYIRHCHIEFTIIFQGVEITYSTHHKIHSTFKKLAKLLKALKRKTEKKINKKTEKIAF